MGLHLPPTCCNYATQALLPACAHRFRQTHKSPVLVSAVQVVLFLFFVKRGYLLKRIWHRVTHMPHQYFWKKYIFLLKMPRDHVCSGTEERTTVLVDCSQLWQCKRPRAKSRTYLSRSQQRPRKLCQLSSVFAFRLPCSPNGCPSHLMQVLRDIFASAQQACGRQETLQFEQSPNVWAPTCATGGCHRRWGRLISAALQPARSLLPLRSVHFLILCA